MSLLTAARAALTQLEHLHGPRQCLHPENCATKATIDDLAMEIMLAEQAENAAKAGIDTEITAVTNHATP